MEFRANGTILVTSGAQPLTAVYTTHAVGERLRLAQDSVQANGEANCQGVGADYVLAHYPPVIYLSLGTDTLRFYHDADAISPLFVATRTR